MRSLLPQALRARARSAGAPRARHRGAPDRRWQALAAVTAVVAVAVAAAGLGRPDAAVAAGTGTVLLTDDFRSATTLASSYVVGGTNFTPCLTAGTSTSSRPVPGCGSAADPNGEGALRLTANVNDQAGFLLYDKALPTKAGLDITFNQYQWGGTLADGITFFLTDGRYTLSRAGAFGGSLGYHHQTTGADGVANALLGIGLDVYGNYTRETNDTARCGTQHTSSVLQPNTVAIRGPGNGKQRYCLLGPAVAAPELATRSGSTRPSPVTVRIVVDPPSTANPRVSVYLNTRLVTSVPQPAELATAPTFKFGWGASTGGQNDFHEINFLQVESVQPIRSDLALTASTTPVASGDTATVSLTARTDAASGPVPANEPVVVTADAPEGTSYGTATGAGWDCSASTPTRVSCTRTSTTAVDPGTTLPTVTVPLTRTAVGSSGRSTVVAQVSAASDDTELALDNTASAEVRWNPVVAPVEAPATVASATPADAVVEPAVVGTAPFTVEVVENQTPAVGTVVVVDGRLVLRPAAGASGDLRATYRVTDADGGVSGTATVSMRVAPVAPAGTATTTAGRDASTTLDAVVGTGPVTAQVVARGAHLSAASVSVDGSGRPVVVVTPEEGWSGTETVTYRVLDATGVPSAPATVTVLVRPVAGDAALEGVLDADGEATVTATLPAGTGTGPLTYTLVGDGDLGGARATLTPSGTLTVVADTGASGASTVRYTVSDGSGTSDEATVDVVIRPYLGTVPDVAGIADAPATSQAPALRGTGPVTWETSTPTGTSVSVAPDGAVTLDPRGRSGTFDVSLVARDADGEPSATRVVRFVVAPVAVPVDGETTAAQEPAATVLTPAAPTGTGPFTLSVATGLPPALGTVAVDAAGTGLAITPAPGVSGTLSATYVVVDAAGLTSAPVRAELRVRPAVAGSSAHVPSGAATAVPLPVPTGTGPFTWTVTSAGPDEACTVEVVDGVATVRAAATYSGPYDVRWTVTDGSGLVSAEALLAVTVDPVAPDEGTGGPARQPGTTGRPVAGPTPQPSGTGPFRFVIVTPPAPAQGTATIDPDTGVVTFDPAPGFSGEVDVEYAATDARGVTSDPATVTFRIAPLAAPTGDTSPGSPGTPARTGAGTPTTLPLPAPVGTGPFTWELVDGPTSDQGTATIDPRTGEVTFVPAPGFSGEVALRYRVVDGAGVPSAPQTLRIDVAPTVTPGPTTGTVVSGGSTTLQLPTPVGRAPFTWTVIDGPTSEQGTVTIDPATGRLTFVAAPGYTGTVRITYAVSDADGVRSEVLSAAVEVRAALAVTGAGALVPAGLAVLLLALGAGLVVTVRRRQA
ncbi:Ig-like domain-containing protein [Cellulomonas sp. JZ18]|uniref:Ig-like domain-containing protein n=1 Tax=Cellulomonas sp. JZ18 TaxID=2654191 RepID=UPI0012D40A5C|nr:Ig-like domain-containing protein [Cellulomonas sp. JZ18]